MLSEEKEPDHGQQVCKPETKEQPEASATTTEAAGEKVDTPELDWPSACLVHEQASLRKYPSEIKLFSFWYDKKMQPLKAALAAAREEAEQMTLTGCGHVVDDYHDTVRLLADAGVTNKPTLCERVASAIAKAREEAASEHERAEDLAEQHVALRERAEKAEAESERDGSDRAATYWWREWYIASHNKRPRSSVNAIQEYAKALDADAAKMADLEKQLATAQSTIDTQEQQLADMRTRISNAETRQEMWLCELLGRMCRQHSFEIYPNRWGVVLDSNGHAVVRTTGGLAGAIAAIEKVLADTKPKEPVRKWPQWFQNMGSFHTVEFFLFENDCSYARMYRHDGSEAFGTAKWTIDDTTKNRYGNYRKLKGEPEAVRLARVKQEPTPEEALIADARHKCASIDSTYRAVVDLAERLLKERVK